LKFLHDASPVRMGMLIVKAFPNLQDYLFCRIDFVATLPSESVQNVHHDSPIGAINLGAGYDHRPDQTSTHLSPDTLETFCQTIPSFLLHDGIICWQTHDIPQ